MKALLLGFVEGVTEFAPVSSTGHLILVDDLWLQSEQFLGKYAANTFKIVIQLGSILAVVVVFWKRLFQLIGFYRPKGHETKQTLNLLHVIIGMLPATIIGFLAKDMIDDHLFSTGPVLIALVVGALFMLFADAYGPKHPRVQSLDDVTYRQALLIGLIQCLSLWPGFSRSGATISGGVLCGLNHRTAADFTFIMAVPIMTGASLVSVVKNWSFMTLEHLPFYIVGFVSAFIFSLLSIRFFLALIQKIKLAPFAYYRLALAVGFALIVYF